MHIFFKNGKYAFPGKCYFILSDNRSDKRSRFSLKPDWIPLVLLYMQITLHSSWNTGPLGERDWRVRKIIITIKNASGITRIYSRNNIALFELLEVISKRPSSRKSFLAYCTRETPLSLIVNIAYFACKSKRIRRL